MRYASSTEGLRSLTKGKVCSLARVGGRAMPLSAVTLVAELATLDNEDGSEASSMKSSLRNALQ